MNEQIDWKGEITEADYKFDLYYYWTSVEHMCDGRKSRRKARFLRKYRRYLDRESYPCLFLNSRRLKPRPIKDYQWNTHRSLTKQISWR